MDMADRRTIKMLAGLVAAMTVGTLAMMAMETDPAGSSVNDFATILAPEEDHFLSVRDTETPIRPERWSSILVAFSADQLNDVQRRSHFVVRLRREEDGLTHASIHRTELWRTQQDVRQGGRIDGLLRVALHPAGLATLTTSDPAFHTLVGLTQRLQRLCDIPADRAYLQSDVDPTSPAASRRLAAAFNANLLSD